MQTESPGVGGSPGCARRADADDAMSSNESAARIAGARLIVIEDSFPIANGLKYLLESVGCNVVGMAGNVAAALDLAATLPFDLALLDIDLHGEHVGPVAEVLHGEAGSGAAAGRCTLAGYVSHNAAYPSLMHTERTPILSA